MTLLGMSRMKWEIGRVGGEEERTQKSVVKGVNVQWTPHLPSSQLSMSSIQERERGAPEKYREGKLFDPGLSDHRLSLVFGGCVCSAFPQSCASLERGYETE